MKPSSSTKSHIAATASSRSTRQARTTCSKTVDTGRGTSEISCRRAEYRSPSVPLARTVNSVSLKRRCTRERTMLANLPRVRSVMTILNRTAPTGHWRRAAGAAAGNRINTASARSPRSSGCGWARLVVDGGRAYDGAAPRSWAPRALGRSGPNATAEGTGRANRCSRPRHSPSKTSTTVARRVVGLRWFYRRGQQCCDLRLRGCPGAGSKPPTSEAGGSAGAAPGRIGCAATCSSNLQQRHHRQARSGKAESLPSGVDTAPRRSLRRFASRGLGVRVPLAPP